MKTALLAASLVLASATGVVLAAKEAEHPGAPTLRQLRSASVQGLFEGTTVRLKGGSYEGKPFVPGGAERPRIELLKTFTATGSLDGVPGDERAALLSATSGGTGARLYLAVFAMHDGKVENVATTLVGDRVEPKGLTIEGRTIALEVVQVGPNDFACCPTEATRRSYWLEPDGLREFADVPFELIHGQIVLRASVGKVIGLNFILDTGSDPSAIDVEAAARAGQAAPDTSKIAGLRVGSEDVPPVEARLTDLSATSRSLGLEIAGRLGYGFLEGRIVQIDFPRRRLRLLPDAPMCPPDALVLPMKTSENDRTPLLEHLVQIDGTSLPVTLDTGSGLGLEVFENARETLGASLWNTPGTTVHATGARGESTARQIRVGAIAIGRFPLESKDLALSERSGEQGARMGRLGNASLAPFVLTLNYRDGQVVFAKP